MAHRRIFKLCTGCAAFVFTATSGLTGMQMHPLSAHPESEDLIAMEMGTYAHSNLSLPSPAGLHVAHHAGGHGQHSVPGSADGCTCLGPCQGGAPPSLPDVGTPRIVLAPVAHLHAVPTRTRVAHQDTGSYLLPLPNPPPVRA